MRTNKTSIIKLTRSSLSNLCRVPGQGPPLEVDVCQGGQEADDPDDGPR